MNKKKVLMFGIALVFLFTGIALATSSAASSDVVICTFDQHRDLNFCLPLLEY